MAVGSALPEGERSVIKLKLTLPADKQVPASRQWTTVDRTPPTNTGAGPTSILPIGSTTSVVVPPDEFAIADATFCSAGFRLFLRNALNDFDKVARATYARLQAERRRIREAALTAATTVRRRMRRNIKATAASAYTLTEENAPHIVAAMLARARHASDLTADTGLIPVVVT